MEVKNVQVYGDPLLIINWMKGQAQFQDIVLRPVREQLKEIVQTLDNLYFSHVFLEINQ